MSGSNSSARASVAVPPTEPATPSPVAMTVHSLDAPPVDEPRRTVVGRWKMLMVMAVCAAPVVASYFTYFVVKPQARSNYSELITPPVDLPAALPLKAVNGAPVAASSLRDQWLLVVVGRSDCNERCQKNLVLVRQLRETLGRDKDRVDKLWFMTDDARPADALLAATGATALHAAPQALADWLKPASGHALEDHVYVVDPMGRWMMRAPVDPDPPKFKRDIERLLRASASWDQAGRP